MVSVAEKYVAAMVLSAAGDAIGYRNGRWEFCRNGKIIHQEVESLGGLENIIVDIDLSRKWRISDDTVMNIATAEAMVEFGTEVNKEKLYSMIAQKYIECMDDMQGRAPGGTTVSCVAELCPEKENGYRVPFHKCSGGCGAAMRSMCIGLRYPRPEQLNDLIAVSIESGRMTHHHPTGYLGAMAAALFTSYALQGKETREWGHGLVSTLDKALKYVVDKGECVEQNKDAWNYFTDRWTEYLKERGISDGNSDPNFPENYDVEERDKTYTKWSYDGWGGASGHDAPMIAYDAFMGSGNSWKELCNRAMFHGGDSDSTGVMAACWYGAINGFHDVPENNYKNIEYQARLEKLAEELLALNTDKLE